MWPIFFLIAEYAVVYLVVAGGVYVSVSVVAGHNRLGKRLFSLSSPSVSFLRQATLF
jgi:hypothetical protein